MTQADLEQEVASLTGESRDEIRRRGFSLVVMPHRGPQMVDWDDAQSSRITRVTSQRAKVRGTH